MFYETYIIPSDCGGGIIPYFPMGYGSPILSDMKVVQCMYISVNLLTRLFSETCAFFCYTPGNLLPRLFSETCAFFCYTPGNLLPRLFSETYAFFCYTPGNLT